MTPLLPRRFIGQGPSIWTWRGALFRGAAAILLAVDLDGNVGVGGTSGVGVCLMVVSAVALAAVARYPRAAGAAVVLVYVLVSALPASVAVTTMVSLGVFLVLADWTAARRWGFVAAWWTMVSLSTAHGARDIALVYLFVLPLGFLAVGAGLVIRFHRRQATALQGDLDEARAAAEAAEQRIREDLAASLHDSLATDLTEALMMTRAAIDLAPADAAGLARIESRLTRSLAQVRALLGVVRPEAPQSAPDPLDAVVTQCTGMLQGAGIDLEANLPPDHGWQRRLPRAVRDVLSVIVRECSLNALKYAVSPSTASLTVEEGPGGVDFTFATLGSVPGVDAGSSSLEPVDAARGGMGLALLRSRAQALGGDMAAVGIGGQWVVSGNLPTGPTEQPVPLETA